MDLLKTQINGCFELQPKIFDDLRGSFVKIFNEIEFDKLGLETIFKEQYYSISKKNVIRGMHFQLPPFDHVKLVSCLQGAVFDVVIDLRLGSPTYGQSQTFELTADKANSIYIPKGMAHGFCTLSDEAILMYNVSTEYEPEYDSGILWKSIDLSWPTQNAILSVRDNALVPFDKFISPFFYA
jgi:dTDP-4-dehydrorhamnose 3,5-epimerase